MKPFTTESYKFCVCVCPWQAFQPSLMLVEKARSLPWSGAMKGASGLTRKHYNRLEKLARDQRSSFSQKLVTYSCKIFYNIGPRLHHKEPFV